ncbi:GAF domain-containing protein [Nocardioides zeae]|uniref:GAF domain-containing protein n=1 Tax=Nocardioides zeae TaxID=1457234 RepID=A0ACC6IM72_9ACTN|nr:GAF and ANTAR domain-containing protein [Nocardioides zeae]MDR6175953.1 GAF domain-containing protein [Nocardioides zeae]MDR6211750.1 GAF domain-containing protein [Nocardioides zeae]
MRAADGPLEVAGFLARVAAELAAASDEVELTRCAARRATELLLGDGAAVVARRRRGRLETVAATDAVARREEELQRELGNGPTLTAVRHPDGLVVEDAVREPRWPGWGGRRDGTAPRSLVAVQLMPTGLHDRHEPLGVLAVHALRPRAFGQEDLEALLLLAVHVSAAWAALRRTVTLAEAAESRHLIGVAQGMLAASAHVPVDASFPLLQGWARAGNVRVRDLAERIIATGGVPDDLELPDTP